MPIRYTITITAPGESPRTERRANLLCAMVLANRITSLNPSATVRIEPA